MDTLARGVGAEAESVQGVRSLTSPCRPSAHLPWYPSITDRLWGFISDSLSPQDAAALLEDLGVEYDTPEHNTLELSPLCAPKATLGKRKR